MDYGGRRWGEEREPDKWKPHAGGFVSGGGGPAVEYLMNVFKETNIFGSLYFHDSF